MFRLGIIEEGLIDKRMLDILKPYCILQRIEHVSEDIEPLWHINEYHIEDAKIENVLDLVKNNIKETWYAHAFNEKSLYVVLQGKWFKLSLYRDETWEEMINYGITEAKVEGKYLENIPLHI